MNVKQVLAAAAVAAALVGAMTSAGAQTEGVAAIVNDRVISTFDVRQRANLLIMSAGVQSTPEMQERARAQALRDLIDEQLQLQETSEYEVNVSPEEVDRRLQAIARQNQTDVPTLTAQLSDVGVSISTLRQQIVADIAWSRLISGLYGTRLRISQAEITATQERIAANLTRPQYQISEIFLPAESDQQFAEMEQGAMRLLQEMQRGAPFPMVARQFSQAPSAAAGGDVGWIASNELLPELQPIAERLQPGQVSLPVRTPAGVYLIAMRDRRAGGAAGASSVIALQQVSAPASQRDALDRLRQRNPSCASLEDQASSVDDAIVVDLGQATEADLSPGIRDRVTGVQGGQTSEVRVEGERADILVVCSRQTGGADVPTREDIEGNLREAELTMLAERHLRNLRREATIITRQ